jgi:hypothetical protein
MQSQCLHLKVTCSSMTRPWSTLTPGVRNRWTDDRLQSISIDANLLIDIGNPWPIDETKFCDLIDWLIDKQLRIID